MVISYEIHETSLRRLVSDILIEMTSVGFCLSYDPLQWNFIAFKMHIISIRKHIVDRYVVSYVTYMCQSVLTLVVI